MEQGEWKASEEGTPQGATISPLLANVYMHYVLDLRIEQWRKRQAWGKVIVVRYADDFIVGFQQPSPLRHGEENEQAANRAVNCPETAQRETTVNRRAVMLPARRACSRTGRLAP